MLITVDFVMRHEPPIWFQRGRAAELLGDGKTLLECLRSEAMTAEERIWLATRNGACSERVRRLFACWCAEQVLPLFERAHPDDDRPRIAIQVATAYAMGEATQEELAAAMDAAYDAACAASAWSAARAAAWAAAWAAYMDASDAAWSAARAAAWVAAWVALATARAAQVAAFIELLETHGG